MQNNFIIRCKCGFSRKSTGLSEDLKYLKEKSSCSSCGKKRTFVCPKCGQNATLFRVRGNT